MPTHWRVFAVLLLSTSTISGQNGGLPEFQAKVAVTDSTGAAIPKANIVIERYSERVTAQADANGIAGVHIPIGHYKVRVSANGFKTAEFTDFVVNDNSALLKATLEVGTTDGGDWPRVDMLVLTSPSQLPWSLPNAAFTGYPPFVYMHFFQPCARDTACRLTDVFSVDAIPYGCCVLTLTNGDGQGNNEVRSYEVFLNGKSILSSTQPRRNTASITIHANNKIKVILAGEPGAMLLVLMSYDPREPK